MADVTEAVGELSREQELHRPLHVLGRHRGASVAMASACWLATPGAELDFSGRASAEEGLKQTSCVNLCNVFTVRQSELRTFVGTVGGEKMRRVCRALAIACGCD